MLFPASKIASTPEQIPGYAPAVNFLASLGATGVERLYKGATGHQRLETTGLSIKISGQQTSEHYK